MEKERRDAVERRKRAEQERVRKADEERRADQERIRRATEEILFHNSLMEPSTREFQAYELRVCAHYSLCRVRSSD